MDGIKDKVAIVTGGSTVIGAAVVRAFHKAGARVVIADIDEKNGEKIAGDLKPNVLFAKTDLADDKQVSMCIEKTVTAFGGIDFLVNLACVYTDNALASTRQEWLDSYNVNVVGGAMMLQAARPHIAKRGGGAVVNFGSISAKVAQTGRWLYPVTKAAILQLTRNEAMDLAADRIRVNSVSPGWTWCRLMDDLTHGDRAKTDKVGGAFHLLGRVGNPDEVAQAVLFLCSSHASFITGTDLAVDGGYSVMGPEMAEPAIPKLMQWARPPYMKQIAIIGAGQSGLQLALGLQHAGYAVTLVSDRTAEEIRAGRVTSSQCMFDWALQTERELNLNMWEQECPPVEGIALSVAGRHGEKQIDWAARLDHYAQAVDQRVKMPEWMERFEKNSGRLVIKEAQINDVDGYARQHALTIIATGKGSLGHLFERDAQRSPYDKPQRALALTYVNGMLPRESYPAVSFNIVPGVGEYFVFPALTESGPCEIMVFEGIPGGPMDCWADVTTPAEHLAKSRCILEEFLPWEAARCANIKLTDPQGILTGSLTPVVRKPVAVLPSGRKVLGLADAVVLNDPLTGQGSNNAAKAADIYLKSILGLGENAPDAEWMQQTFDRYWSGYARWVTEWTNLLLRPPEHVLKILESAGRSKGVAEAVVNGFDDPRSLFPWFMEPVEAKAFLTQTAKTEAERFDRRDFRRALGQFATGVTVVCTRAKDGRRVGLTVNSFSSVSLEPPLVLWSLGKHATAYSDFKQASHFAINVLAADQHHLSRQFSTPVADRFAGVECVEAAEGCPLLKGATAHFVCRMVREFDGGDHVVFLGEVIDYKWQEGEPLIFHSGRYHVKTRHPDLPDE